MSKYIFQIGILISFLVGALSSAQAQDEAPKVIFSGKVTNSAGKKLGGINLSVTVNGQVVHQAASASNGKISEFQMEYGKVLTFKFEKSGYVPKEVIFDLKTGYFPEDVASETMMPYQIKIFKAKPGLDYTLVTKKPVAKGHIDPNTGQLEWDMGYISSRVQEIDQFLEELESKSSAQEEEFKNLVKSGKKAMGSEDYNSAVQSFTSALKLKPDDKDVDALLADAEDALEELEKSQKQEKEFQAKMTEAKQAFDGKDYGGAKALYTEASKLKPDTDEPKAMIEKINSIIMKQLEGEQKYEELISAGDQALLNEKFDEAIGKFEEALKLKPQEEYPPQQLKKAKDLKQKKEAELQAEKDKKDKYDGLITEGNKLLTDKAYENAKSKFKSATEVFPDEQEPKDKIAEIDKILVDLEEQKQKDKEKRDKYNYLITSADKLFTSSKLDESMGKFKEALALFPDEQKPKDKIKEIEKQLKEQKDLKDQYDKLLVEADELFKSKNWQEAKSKYDEAYELINEDHPKSQSTLCQQKLDEQENAAQKQKEEEEKRKKFDEIVASADQNFDNEKWSDARSKYEEALILYPEDQKCKDQINAIKSKLDELKNEAQKQKEDEEKRKKFDEIVTSADQNFDNEKWSDARSKYEEALKLYTEDQKCKDQINAISSKLDELKNKELANAELKKKRDQFDQLLTQADQKFDAEEWESAKAVYKEALALFSDETKPKDRIAEINKRLAELASANQMEAQKKQGYEKLINLADSQFESEQWDDAKGSYEKAIVVDNTQQYPKDQLTKIQKRIDEIANQKNDLQQKANEREEQFRNLINEADTKLKSGISERSLDDLEKAKEMYTEAQSLKPEDKYPPQQLGKVEDAKKSIEKSNLNRSYQDLLQEGQANIDEKNYTKAIENYTKASEIKPNEQLPKEKLQEIQELLKNKDVEARYQDALDSANDLYETASAAKDSEGLKSAQQKYRDALKIKEDVYPEGQIEKIDQELKSIAKTGKQVQYEKILQVARTKIDNNELDKAEELTQRAITFNPDDDRTDKLLEEIRQKREQNKFDALIEEANQLFDSKDYPSSMSKYKEALSINADDEFASLRIDEINKLLAKEEVVEEPKGEINSDLVGWEDADGLSEEELNRLIQDAGRASYETLDSQYEKVLEDKVKFDAKGADLVDMRTTEEYNALENKRSETAEFEKERDDHRQQHVEVRQDYQDKQYELQDNLSKNDRLGNHLLDGEYRTYEFNRERSFADDKKRFETHSKSFEKYHDKKAQLQLNLLDNEKALSHTINEAYGKMRDELAEFVEDVNTEHFKTVEDLDNYQEERTTQTQNWDERAIELTDNLNETYVKEAEKRSAEFEQTDEFRKKGIESLETYADGLDEINRNRSNKAIDQSDKLNETYVNQSEARTSEMEKEDELRKKNLVAMEQYADSIQGVMASISESGQSKAYDRALAYEKEANKTGLENVEANIDKLAKEFPQGVTEKKYMRKDKNGNVVEVTIERIVVEGNRGDRYKKVQGRRSVAYFKNGGAISETIWDTETSK